MKREIFKRGIRMGSCTFGTFFYSENLKKKLWPHCRMTDVLKRLYKKMSITFAQK